jgi:hypothetical protein
MKSVWFLTLLALLVGCSGGGGSSPAPAQNTNVSASPVIGGNPVGVGVNFWLDELFPTKTFYGIRSQIHSATSVTARTTNLINCTARVQTNASCNFNAIPLIGMEHSSPTVDQIMDRVLVSHDWMATRMRQILESMPAETLLMTRGISAIVISFDIRPSFYFPITSAIYIDPNTLWLSDAEFATIDPTPDFRSSFGGELQFTMPWRYVAPGDQDIRSLDRDLYSVTLRTTSLFYHELAHANDYFYPASLVTINRNTPIQNLSVTPRSSQLSSTYPLQSELMFSLADISFGGASATVAQAALTADDVAFEFPADVANDFYNFYTQREDFAMVFEEAMMLYSYGVDRDVAVTNLPQTSNACADYVVAWGQRNRVSDSSIKPRALFAVEALLPEVVSDVEGVLNSYSPLQMRVGEDFCSNIFFGANSARALVRSKQQAKSLPPQTLLPYQ